jgi:hypothetical protein
MTLMYVIAIINSFGLDYDVVYITENAWQIYADQPGNYVFIQYDKEKYYSIRSAGKRCEYKSKDARKAEISFKFCLSR